MSDEIKVTVIKYPDRANLVLCYIDPVSSKRKTKSAGTSNEKGGMEGSGGMGRGIAGRSLLSAVESDVGSVPRAVRSGTPCKLEASRRGNRPATPLTRLNALEPRQALQGQRECPIDLRNEATEAPDGQEGRQAITRPPSRKRPLPTSYGTSRQRCPGASPWAFSRPFPRSPCPRGPKGKKMKGGALVGEQFDRMIDAVSKIRPKDTAEWQRYLTGLWLSGLRLEESITLSWEADSPFAVDLTGRRPRFRIKGADQKNGNDQLLPLTPDFAEFLLQTPEGQRHGRVFRLNEVETGTPHYRPCGGAVGYEDRRESPDYRQCRGRQDGQCPRLAADIRKPLGQAKVAPAILQKLMRHASIQTTMGYYVDLDVDEMADDLWANHPATR